MELHRERAGKHRYLVVDDFERVAELPTRFIRFLERSRAKYSLGTVERYAERITGFLDFIESQYGNDKPEAFSIDEQLRVLDLEDIDGFYSDLHELGRQPSTLRNYEVAVKKFVDWLSTSEAGRIHETSLYDGVGLRTAKPERLVPRFVLPETVKKLLLAMHNEEHRLAAHTMYDVGMRTSELARARAIDLPNPDEYPEFLDYLPIYIRGSKGHGGAIKPRYSIISRPVLSRIHRYHNTEEYKYSSKWSADEKPLLLNSEGNRWTPKALQKCVADAYRRSGLVEKVSAHRFRHGMAVSVLGSDVGQTLLDNLLILQRLLGHNQVNTTEVYLTIPVTLLQQSKRPANPPLSRTS